MEGTVVDIEAMVIMAREKQRLLLVMEEAMEAMGVVMEVVIPEDMVEDMVTMERGKLRLMLNQVIDMVATEVMEDMVVVIVDILEVMGEGMVMVEVMVAMEDLTGDKFFL